MKQNLGKNGQKYLYEKRRVTVQDPHPKWARSLRETVKETFIREEIERLLPRKLKLGEFFGLRFLLEIHPVDHRQIEGGTTIVDLGARVLLQNTTSSIHVVELGTFTGTAELHAPDKWDSDIGYSTATAAALNRLAPKITKALKREAHRLVGTEDKIMEFPVGKLPSRW